MPYIKAAVVLAFLIFGLIACYSSKPARYSIRDNKAYEASLFRQNCAICHGPEGEGKLLDDGKEVSNLRDAPHKFQTEAEIHKHISEGGNGMVPFRDQLSERELRMMVDFVVRDLRGGTTPR